MGKRTGNPRGRPAGSKNKRKAGLEAALAAKAAVVEEAIAGAFVGDSHAYLMSIYKDPGQKTETRIDAAKAALPYEKPRLSSVEMSGGLTINHEDALEQLK